MRTSWHLYYVRHQRTTYVYETNGTSLEFSFSCIFFVSDFYFASLHLVSSDILTAVNPHIIIVQINRSGYFENRMTLKSVQKVRILKKRRFLFSLILSLSLSVSLSLCLSVCLLRLHMLFFNCHNYKRKSMAYTAAVNSNKITMIPNIFSGLGLI